MPHPLFGARDVCYSIEKRWPNKDSFFWQGELAHTVYAITSSPCRKKLIVWRPFFNMTSYSTCLIYILYYYYVTYLYYARLFLIWKPERSNNITTIQDVIMGPGPRAQEAARTGGHHPLLLLVVAAAAVLRSAAAGAQQYSSRRRQCRCRR